jgi:hypothetical protein
VSKPTPSSGSSEPAAQLADWMYALAGRVPEEADAERGPVVLTERRRFLGVTEDGAEPLPSLAAALATATAAQRAELRGDDPGLRLVLAGRLVVVKLSGLAQLPAFARRLWPEGFPVDLWELRRVADDGGSARTVLTGAAFRELCAHSAAPPRRR